MEKELGSVALQASPVSPSPSLVTEPATPSGEMEQFVKAAVADAYARGEAHGRWMERHEALVALAPPLSPPASSGRK